MRTTLLLLTLCLPLAGAAQTNDTTRQADFLGRGRVTLGATVGGGYGSFNGTVFHVTPRAQYFLRDGWSVGLQGRYETNGQQWQSTDVGLFTRYYFLRKQRLALFGQAGATVGRATFRQFDAYGRQPIFQSDLNIFQTQAGLGLHYRLAPRWALEAIGERTVTTSEGLRPSGPWRFGLGLTFRLR